MISRRGFLKLTAGAAVGISSAGLLASSCGGETPEGADESSPNGQEEEAESQAGQGRLLARPAPSPPAEAMVPSTGLRPLGLGGPADRAGLVYVPTSYRAEEGAPLALMLHGAGSDAQGGISPFLDLADEAGLVLLAPESRDRTWDVLVGGYGPDVEFIDQALRQTFDGLAVDAQHLAVGGFSDGASYALSLGFTNGNLFTHVLAFSPGFAEPATRRGEPPVFVSHGTRDEVLPIDRTSRRIVPRLEREGYEVLYREFDGPHTVPEAVASEALGWFISDEGRWT